MFSFLVLCSPTVFAEYEAQVWTPPWLEGNRGESVSPMVIRSPTPVVRPDPVQPPEPVQRIDVTRDDRDTKDVVEDRQHKTLDEVVVLPNVELPVVNREEVAVGQPEKKIIKPPQSAKFIAVQQTATLTHDVFEIEAVTPIVSKIVNTHRKQVSSNPCAPVIIIKSVEKPQLDDSETSHLLDQAAEDHQLAEIAMQVGDYAEAYSIWLPLAKSGDAEAQFSLGWMYHNGYGLSINNLKTLKYWRSAADQGKADALFSLGMLFSQGDKKVKRDLAQAVFYYLKAIDRGHEDARDMLSYLVQQNSKKIRPVVADWGLEEWLKVGVQIPVVVDRANARHAPNTKSKIVAVLNKTDKVLVIYRQARWVRVYSLQHKRLFWLYDGLLDKTLLEENL